MCKTTPGNMVCSFAYLLLFFVLEFSVGEGGALRILSFKKSCCNWVLESLCEFTPDRETFECEVCGASVWQYQVERQAETRFWGPCMPTELTWKGSRLDLTALWTGEFEMLYHGIQMHLLAGISYCFWPCSKWWLEWYREPFQVFGYERQDFWRISVV